ncbi:uncharacterized protein L201_007784 [Kwoniella dendrophila CBS 6074]|uniref:Homeobox domain-containing protein n=1 Tax=Kwoniella dendrophila CBS 6074 TaxID=1295534 RepID=A0AAX4K7M8_9TREE
MVEHRDQIIASSPEISPKTPTMMTSPSMKKVKELHARSRSASQDQHHSLIPPPKGLAALLSTSPPDSPISIRSISHSPENQRQTQKPAATPYHPYRSPPQTLPHLSSAPPNQRSYRNLPRLKTSPITYPRIPSSSSPDNDVEAFKSDAILTTKSQRHDPFASAQLISPAKVKRSYWRTSPISDADKTQQRNLPSLSSLQIGHKTSTYPTPISNFSQKGFSIPDRVQIIHTRHRSDEHRESNIPRPLAHVRHPSSGQLRSMQHHELSASRTPDPSSASLIAMQSYGQPLAYRRQLSSHHNALPRPHWAAPPPPPPSASHIRVYVNSHQYSRNPEQPSRPNLRIRPYASPRYDLPGCSTGGQGGRGIPQCNVERESVFASPLSGMSPGDFKAPRKRADGSQLSLLNDVFGRTAYPCTEERDELARTLGMTSRSVQIWFQNRRRAVKVDAQSAVQRAEAEVEKQTLIRGPIPSIPRPHTSHSRVGSEGGMINVGAQQIYHHHQMSSTPQKAIDLLPGGMPSYSNKQPLFSRDSCMGFRGKKHTGL